jgi:hypothetical protein
MWLPGCEFRSFSVVKQINSDLLIPDYLAAPSSFSSCFLSDYFAAGAHTTVNSRLLLLPKASAAATQAGFFDNRSLTPFRHFEQSAAVKVNFSISGTQQHFTFTPGCWLCTKIQKGYKMWASPCV